MSSSTTHTIAPSTTVILSLALVGLLPMITTVFASNRRQPDILSKHFHLGQGDSADISAILAKYDLRNVIQCAGTCVTAVGCKSFFYSRLTRVCQIHNKVLKPRKNGIQRSGEHYFCKVNDRTGPTAVSEAENVERLLFTPYGDRSPHTFKQYFLKNKTVTRYSDVQVAWVTDAFYIWTVRKLIVSSLLLLKVFSVPSDNLSITDLKTSVRPHGLGVDVNQQIIFFGHGLDKYKLSKMTIDGKNFQTFFYLPYRHLPHSIAVDSVHRRLYYTDIKHVVTVGYDGKDHHIVYNGSWVAALAVNPSGDYLYYGNRKRMFNMSLSHPEKTKMIRLKYSLQKFLFCADRLYASPSRGKYKLGFVQGNVFSELSGLSPTKYKSGSVIAITSECGHD